MISHNWAMDREFWQHKSRLNRKGCVQLKYFVPELVRHSVMLRKTYFQDTNLPWNNEFKNQNNAKFRLKAVMKSTNLRQTRRKFKPTNKGTCISIINGKSYWFMLQSSFWQHIFEVFFLGFLISCISTCNMIN